MVDQVGYWLRGLSTLMKGQFEKRLRKLSTTVPQ